MCFFCRSYQPCPTCFRCRKCCSKWPRGCQTPVILGGLGQPGGLPQSATDPEGGLHSSFCSKTKFDQNSCGRKRLCRCNQAGAPGRCIACVSRQKSGETSKTSNLSGLLQQVVFSSKTKPKMEANSGPKNNLL